MTAITPLQWYALVDKLLGTEEVNETEAGKLGALCLDFFSWFGLKVAFGQVGTLALRERWDRESELETTTVRAESDERANDIDLAELRDDEQKNDEDERDDNIDVLMKRAGIEDGEVDEAAHE